MSSNFLLVAHVVIGWTESDPATGYSSFSDGYRLGAEQVTLAMTLTLPSEQTVDQIADAAYVATNAPHVEPGGLAHQILGKIEEADFTGQGAHYSLSVGDTVTVDGIMIECVSLGWKEVITA